MVGRWHAKFIAEPRDQAREAANFHTLAVREIEIGRRVHRRRKRIEDRKRALDDVGCQFDPLGIRDRDDLAHHLGRETAQVGVRVDDADRLPGERGQGIIFEDEIKGGNIPKEYIPAVDKGVKEQLTNGVIAGYPVVDVKVTLYDGSYHDVDSSEMAFKIAGSMAFKEGALKASPVLLEPIMEVEVVTPEDYMGDVMGDLNRRRGLVQGMEDAPAGKIVRAEVPLAEMFGYATDLRSRTQGRATHTMQFHSYQDVPESIAQEIVARVRGE